MKLRWTALTLLIAQAACAHGSRSPATPLSWTMFQNGLTHDAIVASTWGPVHWDSNLSSKVNGGLAYDGEDLFAVDFAGDLIAIDPHKGHVLWRARADDVLMSTPIVADGMVFVGSGTNAMLWEHPQSAAWGRAAGNHWYAFRADDGALVWSHHVVGEAMPSAVYTDGKLIFATGDNLATALDARTGRTLWETPLPGVPTMSSAMVDDGMVFLAVTQGKPQYLSPTRSHTIALDVNTGAARWSAPYGNGDCTPTVAAGMVFMEGSDDGPSGTREAIGTNNVVALDERTGMLRWRYESASGFFTAVGSNERSIAATYAGGVLYQAVPAVSEMVAFRASDGRALWTMHTSASVKMSPIVTGGSVYFGDTAGVLYRLDQTNGNVITAIPYDRPFTTSPPLLVGQTLFLANTDYVRAIPLSKL